MKKKIYQFVPVILFLSCSRFSLSLNEAMKLRLDSEFSSPHSISKTFTEEKIAVFGDSISIFWPYKFAEISKKDVDNFAAGGASYTFPNLYPAAPSIEEQIAKANLSNYQMLIVAAGTNDWFLGQINLLEFKNTLSRIYTNLSKFNARVVIVIPIHYVDKLIDISNADSYPNHLTSYRKIIYEEAVNHGFDIINASMFEEFPPVDTDVSKIYMNNLNGDYLHPSYPVGTDRLAERIYGVLTETK